MVSTKSECGPLKECTNPCPSPSDVQRIAWTAPLTFSASSSERSSPGSSATRLAAVADEVATLEHEWLEASGDL